ncbi:UNVERIFIED_CONTAM: hypothetical protein NCL1_56490 [Trichonephila clavipes]
MIFNTISKSISLSSLLGAKWFRSSLAMLPAIEKRRSQGTDDPTKLTAIYLPSITYIIPQRQRKLSTLASREFLSN